MYILELLFHQRVVHMLLLALHIIPLPFILALRINFCPFPIGPNGANRVSTFLHIQATSSYRNPTSERFKLHED